MPPVAAGEEQDEEVQEKDFFSYAFEDQKQEAGSESSGDDVPKKFPKNTSGASRQGVTQKQPKVHDLEPEDASLESVESIYSHDDSK